jgi:NO-binding membrane sensor protein with MHYT domain
VTSHAKKVLLRAPCDKNQRLALSAKNKFCCATTSVKSVRFQHLMNPTSVNTSFDIGLVALSFSFAVIGSFVALSAAGRLVSRNGRLSLSNLLTIGVALGGVGVWSMHFIGMLALKMDVGSSYSMTETFASMLIAVVATAASVAIAAKQSDSIPRLIVAGVFLGLSVVAMHYLGMFGLKIYGFITWNFALVGASILIAVLAATVALWLAFNSLTIRSRMGAALVMAVAVCAMHYTGMAAAEFICTTPTRTAIPQGTGFISAFRLPLLVITTTVLLTVFLSLDQLFQHLHASHRTDAKRSRQS